MTITGRGPLLRRPVGPLLDALRQCGASVHGSGTDGTCPPVITTGRSGRLGGRVTVDASTSSQFVSALLLVAPYFDDDLVVEHRNLGAEGFVDLTVELMKHHGVLVVATDNRLEVPARLAYQARDEVVQPDASAASHLFTLAVATGGAVTVEDMRQASGQPDFGVLGVFEEFGAAVSEEPDGGVTVVGPDRLNPVDTDLRRMPDQLPNVAVLAALAHGTSTIRGVGITRFHETDRIKAIAQELGKAGVAVEVGDDDVVIHGGRPLPGATFWAYDDHRMAMSLAAFAAVVGGSWIDGADAVSKTYPAFWSDAKTLALRWTSG